VPSSVREFRYPWRPIQDEAVLLGQGAEHRSDRRGTGAVRVEGYLAGAQQGAQQRSLMIRSLMINDRSGKPILYSVVRHDQGVRNLVSDPRQEEPEIAMINLCPGHLSYDAPVL
jgi:hypothetical protein